MTGDIDGSYDKRTGTLQIRVNSYYDALENNELTDEFLGCLLNEYREVEQAEKKKRQRNFTSWQKARELIRKKKTDHVLPVRQIHVFPGAVADIESEEIRDAIVRSIGTEAEAARIAADRWELFEDVAVGADLLIDVSAMATGLVRFIGSGQLREGVTGFGYLAMVGMGLLIAYFLLRIFGEEPCKRRAKYLTHILRTPVTLHRKTSTEPDVTFYPDAGSPANSAPEV